MEARKITIVHTKNQKKSVIMTSAETLSELKDDLRTNGIDYTDMTFYEGLTKTELKTDDSVLPHDVNYKGNVTNELVFMLTNADKKIKSGAMTRAEAYDLIKKNKLQEEVKKRFGKNFTMCKTDDLISLIEEVNKGMEKEEETPEPVVEVTEEVKEEVKEVVSEKCDTCIDVNARAAIRRIAELLMYDDNNFDEDDYNEIKELVEDDMVATFKHCVAEEQKTSPYSDDEINKMFRGM